MHKWARAFTIFAEHGGGPYDIGAEHDVIYVHAPQVLSTDAAGEELLALGWYKDEHRGEAGPVNEEESWYHYA